MKGSGGLAGTRTQDQRLKRPLLYRLSYQPGTAKEKPVFGPYTCGIKPARNAPAKSKAPGKLTNQPHWCKAIYQASSLVAAPILHPADVPGLGRGISGNRRRQRRI